MQRLILIVDDDEDDRELLEEAIMEIDQSLVCIPSINGVEGLQWLKNANPKPDAIFLDLNMPRVNGQQFLTEIKTNQELQHIPVVIFTTAKAEEAKEETKSLGAAYFITKPVRYEELLDEIKLALEKTIIGVD